MPQRSCEQHAAAVIRRSERMYREALARAEMLSAAYVPSADDEPRELTMTRSLIVLTATLTLALTFAGISHPSAAAPPTAIKDCNARFHACVADCGKTKKCTVQCGGPWEQCTKQALAMKPPKGLTKKPRRRK
jgi:hypothetical protein